MFTVETYAPPELRSARVSFNLLIIVSHITVSGCDVPNTRRVLRHTSLRVVSACRRSARVDFGSLDMVSALFLRMQRVKSWSCPRAHRTAGMVFCARVLASSNRSRLVSDTQRLRAALIVCTLNFPPRISRPRPRRPPCIFRRRGIALRCRRGVFSCTSACGRGASGPSGKFCYNILSDTVRIAARRGPVARRRRGML